MERAAQVRDEVIRLTASARPEQTGAQPEVE